MIYLDRAEKNLVREEMEVVQKAYKDHSQMPKKMGLLSILPRIYIITYRNKS